MAVAFRATNALRHGEERTLIFSVAPDARLPGVAVDSGAHGCSSPGVGDRGREFVGDGRECPTARSGILEELRDESAAVRLGHVGENVSA